MEFFHLIKATQKSGKQDAVIWFSAKSEARAALTLDVELEEAGIETGRGKDYAKPIRTDMPVCNDLPEEGTVDYTWCERYELQDDNRTWLPKVAGESSVTVDFPSAPAGAETALKVETTTANIPLENRTPASRFAVHLASDKYLTHITKEQQMAASEMVLEEGNTYLHSLLKAKSKTPEVDELSLNVEWKLVQAIKQVFAPDEEHEAEVIAVFIGDWVKAEAGDRNQLVDDWLRGKFPLLKAGVKTDETDLAGGEDQSDDNTGFESKIIDTRDNIATMPFRIQLLAQFSAEERHVYHINKDTRAQLASLEMDTDNSYVQNLLLAAENAPEIKAFDMPTLWKLTTAVKAVFPQDKRSEMSLLMRFIRIWISTEHIDRGLLVKEWLKGNRVEQVQRTDVNTNAGGGNKTDRNPSLTHTLDTLDIEIALATLPLDFNIYDIPGGVFRRAKEIISKKESPFKEWSKTLRKTAGILDYSRAAIFALIRSAAENAHHFPVSMQTYINANLTEADHEKPTAETLAAARHTPEVSWESEVNEQIETEKMELAGKPQVAKIGSGIFSIDGLMGGGTDPVITTTSNEIEKAVTVSETTSDVQMEKTHNDEVQNGLTVPEGQGTPGAVESGDETGIESDALNNDSGHQIEHDEPCRLFTHLMLDIETMGKKPGAPVVSIGAVFFAPGTGETGAEFYQVISLESCMSFGAVPDASTILWWLRQSAEARSEILVDNAVGLVEALEMFDSFIAENAANGSRSVQLWGNGSSFDCTLIEAAFELADIPFPIAHWNYRDVRTVVEMGKAVGLNCRYDIPFEGDQHHALADARHQVKYVSAIWQHLTAN